MYVCKDYTFGGTSTRAYTRTQARSPRLEALLHNDILGKHPLYSFLCSIYYCTILILPLIAPPRPQF